MRSIFAHLNDPEVPRIEWHVLAVLFVGKDPGSLGRILEHLSGIVHGIAVGGRNSNGSFVRHIPD